NLDGLKTVTIDETTPVTSRPDILAAEAGVTKAESDLKLQRRGPVPDLTVSVLFERQQPDQPNTVGFGVSMPVPLWNRNTANILAAKAVRDQAQTQLEKVRVQASADVTITRLAYAEAQTRAETYLHQLRPRSAEITQTVAYAYSKGGASLVELLQAERDDNDIRLATARAQADAASAAVGLAAALNRLDPNLAK
ncbi:MAG TPA: TolC family protein, partial [Opitutaceae bacterium]|nr:TolC family protein [Opitutaceae bacterium]